MRRGRGSEGGWMVVYWHLIKALVSHASISITSILFANSKASFSSFSYTSHPPPSYACRHSTQHHLPPSSCTASRSLEQELSRQDSFYRNCWQKCIIQQSMLINKRVHDSVTTKKNWWYYERPPRLLSWQMTGMYIIYQKGSSVSFNSIDEVRFAIGNWLPRYLLSLS